MILSRILIALAVLISFFSSNAQIAIGHYTDLDGLPTEMPAVNPPTFPRY